MPLRLDYRVIAPDAVKALAQVNAYLSRSAIDPTLRRLVEIRTSEINGCTYCIRLHRREALAIGETVVRLGALAAWRSSPLFSDREPTALAWTEAVTLIAETHAPDEVYHDLGRHFTDREIVDLPFVITTMNAWNRLAISMCREADN